MHKVLFITDSFMELNGAERNVLEIVTRVDQKKFTPILCALRMRDSLKKFVEKKGIKVIHLNLKKIYGFEAVRKMVYMYRLIKNENIEIVVTYHDNSDFFGAVAAKLANVPVIISSRRDMGYNLKKRHVWAYKIINLLFDQIITVSNKVKQTIESRERVSPSKIKTIYSGVDLIRFSNKYDKKSLKKELGIDPHNKVVGMIASVRPIKGHKVFLKAVNRVINKHPDTSFLIVGSIDDSNLYEELKNMMKEYNIEKNVIFTGERMDIPAILSIMDVSVLTSTSEGFSNTVIESMAMGKPVIASDVGGNPEAIDDGENGILVPPANPEAVANSINLSLDNKMLSDRMGKEARIKVERQFSIEMMIETIQENYINLLWSKNHRWSFFFRRYNAKQIFSKTIKLILSDLLYYSGIVFMYMWMTEKFSRRHGIKILSYHRITDEEPDYLNLKIKVQNFAKQMEYLKNHYNIISLDHALSLLSNKLPVPPKTVVITFDDGYKDNFTNAFPILNKYRIPATIFLTVGLINNKERLWFEDIIYAIARTAKNKIDLSLNEMDNFSLKNFYEKNNAISKIVSYMKTLDNCQKEKIKGFILADLIQDNNDITENDMLLWEDIYEMSKYGISFGSHTMTHPILSRIPMEDAEKEMRESKEILEKMLRKKITSFAYPNGKTRDFNGQHIQILKRIGYSCAFTLVPGININNDDNDCMFLLRRKGIENDMLTNIFGTFSRSLFAAEMSGIFDFALLRKYRQRNEKMG